MADDENRQPIDKMQRGILGEARDNWKGLPSRIALSLLLFLSLGLRVIVNA